eukprot:GHRR01002126.1.p1 GENE.GHRR01002126.1~~GHRR01002126.1.p1  ORF type:complete len:250 (+),score=40.46 GHRR01002126.1:185-934(+)
MRQFYFFVCGMLLSCSRMCILASEAITRSDIKGNDIDCGQNRSDGCRICGDINSVDSSCTSNPSCVAYTYDGSCGYLKSAAEPKQYREGFTTFVLPGKGSAPAVAGPNSPTATPLNTSIPAAAAVPSTAPISGPSPNTTGAASGDGTAVPPTLPSSAVSPQPPDPSQPPVPQVTTPPATAAAPAAAAQSPSATGAAAAPSGQYSVRCSSPGIEGLVWNRERRAQCLRGLLIGQCWLHNFGRCCCNSALG